MTRKQVRQTGQLFAEDENGKRYKIIEYTTFLNDGSFQKPNEWVPGLKAYKLENGTRVNKLSDTEFETWPSGSIIKLRMLPKK
jgi:hypothetical protein